MGRRYDVWRCKCEEFIRLKHRWCELLEAESRGEKEPECKTIRRIGRLLRAHGYAMISGIRGCRGVYAGEGGFAEESCGRRGRRHGGVKAGPFRGHAEPGGRGQTLWRSGDDDRWEEEWRGVAV